MKSSNDQEMIRKAIVMHDAAIEQILLSGQGPIEIVESFHRLDEIEKEPFLLAVSAKLALLHHRGRR